MLFDGLSWISPHKYVYDSSYNDVQYDYDIFEKYDTVILKACCGTGKTTAVADHVKKYMDANPGTKFLSIVDRTSLADQHIKSFKSLNMQDYRTIKTDPCKASAFVLCINSLDKLCQLTKEDKNKYIVFIDEITFFLNISHNSTLDKNIKYVYNMLTSIIRNTHKVIVGDAIILENVFEILKNRIMDEKQKTLSITNNYNKFQGVPAVRVKSERLMLQKLIDQCKEGKPFLFGCDSATIATDFYNKCIDKVSTYLIDKGIDPEEELKKFILITDDNQVMITDAEQQFKDMYVFYSPKITYGVDFSIGTAQNVYIYQKGESIMPNGTFQQTTRTRNIQTLYYYSECKEHDAKYTDLEDVKETLRKNIQYFKKSTKLLNVSTIYDEDEETYKIIENSFFNLYTYNEYMIDLYKMNMTKHYEELLKMNGFVMSSEGIEEKLDKQEKTKLKELSKEIRAELFKEYIETEYKGAEKYDTFNKHIEFEYITNKLIIAKRNSYDIKNMSMIYSKVKAVRDLEKKYKIQPLQVDYKLFGDIHMDDNEYNYIKNVFRITREKPTNYGELRVVYISMVRSITNNDLLKSERSMKKETQKKMIYSIDDDYIQYHLDLNKLTNTSCTHFHEQFVTKYNIEVVKTSFNNTNEDHVEYEYDIDEQCRLLDVII